MPTTADTDISLTCSSCKQDFSITAREIADINRLSLTYNVEWPFVIEGAMNANTEQKTWRNDMANIGSFTFDGKRFDGEINTLQVRARGIRIIENTNRMKASAPDYRILAGRAEIGAAWEKKSNDGVKYLSVKVDDPSFNAPLYASLFADDQEGKNHTLVWTRPNSDTE